MARKIIHHPIRLEFETWFQKNVSPVLPTQEALLKAKKAVQEAQIRYERLIMLKGAYDTGLELAQLIPVQDFRKLLKTPHTPLESKLETLKSEFENPEN